MPAKTLLPDILPEGRLRSHDLIQQSKIRPGPKPSAINCDVISLRDLTSEIWTSWDSLRNSNPNLCSPFFSSGFAKAYASIRGNAWIAVIREENNIVALLPFERTGRTLFPIGRMINDAHGLICGPQFRVDWDWLLTQLKASCFRFHALIDTPSTNAGTFDFARVKTFLCDLKLPQEGYIAWLKNNKKTIAKQQQKTNKLIRQVGPLRLEMQTVDDRLLQQILDLKSEQYQRTKLFDKFSISWIREFLHLLLHQTHPTYGQLSVLYAGDKLIAGHMGMRERKLLHYWFPVYDTQFDYASPGTALFLEIVKQASVEGIDKIDFGYGELPYKWKLNNVISEMGQGAVCSSMVRWHILKLRYQMLSRLKQMPCKEMVKSVVRKTCPSFGATELNG